MTIQASDAPARSIEVHLGAEPAQRADPMPDHERRRSGRRARALDRLMDRATHPYPPNAALRKADNVENLLLFVDDDLRETALALTRIEGFLTRTLEVLDAKDLRREHVIALARDAAVLEHIDLLNETVESLRRRLVKLASAMR